KALVVDDAFGLSEARAFRSTFPFGKVGRASTKMKPEGTMCSGSFFCRASRTSDSEWFQSGLGTMYATSRPPLPSAASKTASHAARRLRCSSDRFLTRSKYFELFKACSLLNCLDNCH